MRRMFTLTRRRRWSAAGAAGVGVLALAVVGSMGMSAVPRAAALAGGGGGSCSGPTVTSQPFGKTTEPYTGKEEIVYRYTLTNCHRMQVRILSYGGIVQSVVVPDRHGHLADVVLGFRTLNDYVKYDSPPVITNGGPYFGETVGRYANRIA